MLGQKYSVPLRQPDHMEARPGQLVFEDNESDEIIGFVADVYPEQLIIILFRPREMPANATVIEEQLQEEEMLGILKSILDGDEEIRDMWKQIANA